MPVRCSPSPARRSTSSSRRPASMPVSAASASSSSRLAGVPLLAGSMAIMVLFGRRLLPQRNGATMPADFSRHAKTLVEQYGLASGIFQLRVRDSSSLRRQGPFRHRPLTLSRPRADGRPGQGHRHAAPPDRMSKRATRCSSAARRSRPPTSPCRCISPSATSRPPAAARMPCSMRDPGSPRC